MLENKIIHIFKAGTHTDMTGKVIEFSNDAVAKIASGFNAKSSAPIVVGHPKDNTPAFGWVKKLQFSDGNLYATVGEINADFAKMVKSGTYKKISSSFYSPNSSNNPNPGQYSLKHVGFLGGASPAVAGLQPVQFGEDEDDITVEFCEFKAPTSLTSTSLGEVFRNLKNYLIAKDGLEIANNVIPEWMVNNISSAVDAQGEVDAQGQDELTNKSDDEINQKEGGMSEIKLSKENTDLEKAKAELEKEKAELAKEKKALQAEKEKVQTDSDYAESKKIVDGFVLSGKVLPTEAEGLTQFIASLGTAEVSFATDGGEVTQSPLSYIQGFIGGLIKRTPETGYINVGDHLFSVDNSDDIVVAANRIVDESKGTISFVEAVGKVQIK